MSRVGKQPISLPSDVKASVVGSLVNIEGKLGKLSFAPGTGVSVEVKDGKILVSAQNTADAQVRANYGTARATLNNMVLGVSKGWKRSLELNGVGYTAQLQGANLKLAVGFSHDVFIAVPKEVKCTVTKNQVDLESADKELVGTLAARIRRIQPPEPYLGKGIKFVEETIRRKAGKTGKK